MGGYLALVIYCEECRGENDDTVVTVLGEAATLRKARSIADAEADRFSWAGHWSECEDGSHRVVSCGELRIIDLDQMHVRLKLAE